MCTVAFVLLLAAFELGCGAAKVSNAPPPAAGSLSPSSTTLNFGNVPVGTNKTAPVSLTNTGSQNATVQVSQVLVSGSGFNATGANPPITLAAGQKITLNVTFMPASPGAVSGSVSVVSTASDPTTTITLAGTGIASGQLVVNPSSLSFGSVQVGSSKTLLLTLTNPAGQGSSIQVSQLTASGPGFSVSGATLPLTLAVGQSYTLNVNFAPTTAGTDTGSLALVSDASNPNITVALSGTAANPGTLAVVPATMDFGTVTLGNSQVQTGTLTASNGGVTVSSASWNGPGFTVSGISFPVTLASGQSTPFSVTFTPQSANNATGSITFLSNSTNSPTTEQLAGTGQAAQHSVSLSWNASTSQIQGYYVYRGSQTGGPYSRISSLVPQLTYTDTAVVTGATYYYVVTALGTNNVESSDSNQVLAVIP